MPAKSKKQQMAMGIALEAKRGEIPMSKLGGSSRQMAGSMTVDQLRDFAKTRRKGLPRRKKRKSNPKKKYAEALMGLEGDRKLL